MGARERESGRGGGAAADVDERAVPPGLDPRLQLALRRRIQQRKQERQPEPTGDEAEAQKAELTLDERFAQVYERALARIGQLDVRDPLASQRLGLIRAELSGWLPAFENDPRTPAMRMLLAAKEMELEREAEKREAHQGDGNAEPREGDDDGGGGAESAAGSAYSLFESLFDGGTHPLSEVFRSPMDADPPTVERPLDGREISDARVIFGSSLRYDQIRITRHSDMTFGDTSRTIGNTINLDEDCFDQSLGAEGTTLNSYGLQTLIHEMTHVWQYQHSGMSYIPQSLMAQAWARVADGDRNAAYEYQGKLDAGEPFWSWNPEQQAYFVEQYNLALGRVAGAAAQMALPDKADIELLTKARPIIDQIQRGQGAPPRIPMLPAAPTGDTLTDIANSIVA